MSSPGRAIQDIKLDIEFDDNEDPLDGVDELKYEETTVLENIEADAEKARLEKELCNAAFRNDIYTVKRILKENQKREEKIDVNYHDPTCGVTALHWAAEKGNVEIIEELLKVPGININEKMSMEGEHSRGETSLMRAIEHYKYDAMNRLLQIPGIDVNCQDKYGFTAMFIAIEWGSSTAIKTLLEKKDELHLDLSIKDKKGKTALFFASYTTHIKGDDFIDILINSLDYVNEKENENWTPLQIAVLKGHTSAVEELLKCPLVDRQVQDGDGRTVLHLAALYKMPVKNAKDKTKLEVEVEENDTVLKLMSLLQKGDCNMTVLDNQGLYASNYMSDHRSPELLKLYLDNCIEKELKIGKVEFEGDRNKQKKVKIDIENYNIEKLKLKLDKCIDKDAKKELKIGKAEVEEDRNKQKKVKIDIENYNISISLNSFDPLTSTVRDSMAFQPFIDADSQNIHHPVISLYLKLKWIQIRKFYFINFVFYAIFVSILTSFILCSFAGNASAELKNTLLVLTILMTIREILQMFASGSFWSILAYFKSQRNWFEITMLCFTYTLIFADLTWPSSLTNHMAAVLILLSWGEFFMTLGRHPKMSIYIKLFLTVSKTFITVIIVYSSLLLGFTFCLYILLHKPEGTNQADDQPLYGSVPKGIFKILVMSFTGEAEYGNMLFNDDWEQIYFMIFIFFIMVVLINLLNGLAITDIGQLKTASENAIVLRRYQSLLEMEENVNSFWPVLQNRLKVFGNNRVHNTPWKLSMTNKVLFNKPELNLNPRTLEFWTFGLRSGPFAGGIPFSILENAIEVLKKKEGEANRLDMSIDIEKIIMSQKHK